MSASAESDGFAVWRDQQLEKLQAKAAALGHKPPGPTSIAEALARCLHSSQVDRAGKPYIGHIERVVANLLRRWPDASQDEIAAAWLHDAIEDAGQTPETLIAAGVSPEAAAVVRELTRPAGSTYLEWITSLAERGSISAVRVKLADNEDNSSPARVAAIPEGPQMLARRYQPARRILEARIAVPSAPPDPATTNHATLPATTLPGQGVYHPACRLAVVVPKFRAT